MTWYFDISDDGTEMDVYDHNGNLVETVQNDGSGFTIPGDIHAVMRNSMEGNQPSAYNQSLIADAATNNFEKGTP